MGGLKPFVVAGGTRAGFKEYPRVTLPLQTTYNCRPLAKLPSPTVPTPSIWEVVQVDGYDCTTASSAFPFWQNTKWVCISGSSQPGGWGAHAVPQASCRAPSAGTMSLDVPRQCLRR